jgi:hypothetical protein
VRQQQQQQQRATTGCTRYGRITNDNRLRYEVQESFKGWKSQQQQKNTIRSSWNKGIINLMSTSSAEKEFAEAIVQEEILATGIARKSDAPKAKAKPSATLLYSAESRPAEAAPRVAARAEREFLKRERLSPKSIREKTATSRKVRSGHREDPADLISILERASKEKGPAAAVKSTVKDLIEEYWKEFLAPRLDGKPAIVYTGYPRETPGEGDSLSKYNKQLQSFWAPLYPPYRKAVKEDFHLAVQDIVTDWTKSNRVVHPKETQVEAWLEARLPYLDAYQIGFLTTGTVHSHLKELLEAQEVFYNHFQERKAPPSSIPTSEEVEDSTLPTEGAAASVTEDQRQAVRQVITQAIDQLATRVDQLLLGELTTAPITEVRVMHPAFSLQEVIQAIHFADFTTVKFKQGNQNKELRLPKLAPTASLALKLHYLDRLPTQRGLHELNAQGLRRAIEASLPGTFVKTFEDEYLKLRNKHTDATDEFQLLGDDDEKQAINCCYLALRNALVPRIPHAYEDTLEALQAKDTGRSFVKPKNIKDASETDAAPTPYDYSMHSSVLKTIADFLRWLHDCPDDAGESAIQGRGRALPPLKINEWFYKSMPNPHRVTFEQIYLNKDYRDFSLEELERQFAKLQEQEQEAKELAKKHNKRSNESASRGSRDNKRHQPYRGRGRGRHHNNPTYGSGYYSSDSRSHGSGGRGSYRGRGRHGHGSSQGGRGYGGRGGYHGRGDRDRRGNDRERDDRGRDDRNSEQFRSEDQQRRGRYSSHTSYADDMHHLDQVGGRG